jgi:hypothetical protein
MITLWSSCIGAILNSGLLPISNKEEDRTTTSGLQMFVMMTEMDNRFME